jgi:DNA-binding transcriptional MerR regulator
MSGDGELPLVRRSGKSEAAFRTISEVADELDVPQHVLRFWESKFPQVKPLKRGGGRRYYRPEDVALLRRIRDLLYSEGYTIKGVQKLLREGGHKDTASNSVKAEPVEVEAEAQADAEPEVMEDEVAEPIPEEGEEEEGEVLLSFDEPEEEIVVEPAPQAPEAARFSPEIRRELADLLDELEQLRVLLQPR